MGAFGFERGFAVVAGGVLIALGLLGSLGNPLIGRPEAGAVLTSGAGLDLIHVVSGALFVHVGLALNGRNRANGLMALGVFYIVIGTISFLSSDLFGLFGASSSGIGTIAHIVLGVAALVVGWMGRGGELREVGRRVSRPARR
jgi:hypothetical protein